MNSTLFRHAVLFAALACVGCSGAAAPPEPTPLRVMTYNIQAGRGDLEGVAETIRTARADLVALQEVAVHWGERTDMPDQAEYLAGATGMHVFFGSIYTLAPASAGDPPREFGLALLSRRPIVAARNHEITRLSTQDPDPEPAPLPGFVEVVVEVDGTAVHVFDTHLDYRADPRVRRMQVAEMLAIVGDASGPALLLGDLNAPPDAEELQPLFSRLYDAWDTAAGPGHTAPNPGPERRIDYILYSDDFDVRDARVIESLASDHLPVIAELVLRQSRR